MSMRNLQQEVHTGAQLEELRGERGKRGREIVRQRAVSTDSPILMAHPQTGLHYLQEACHLDDRAAPEGRERGTVTASASLLISSLSSLNTHLNLQIALVVTTVICDG